MELIGVRIATIKNKYLVLKLQNYSITLNVHPMVKILSAECVKTDVLMDIQLGKSMVNSMPVKSL